MKAGESTRIQCEECGLETEIVLEPKAVGMEPDERPNDEADVTCCPLCSSDSIVVETEA
jgi:hypothetical protein